MFTLPACNASVQPAAINKNPLKMELLNKSVPI